MNKQTGFTLIELVMVIVILGILSAFAIPKYADFAGDARVATLEGVAAAMSAAASIAHAEQKVSGAGDNDSVTIEGSVVTMINGYPTANAAGIESALSQELADSGNFVLSGGGTAATSVLTITLDAKTDCTITYTAAAANGSPDIAVNGDDSDCS